MEEELKAFDFWGYCDLDQIFGDLNRFITDEILEKYDKLFCLGHMTLFRNTQSINQLFTKKLEDKTYLKTSYKQIFEDENNYVFDEWPEKIVNINVLAKQENIKVYYDKNGILDVMAFRSIFANVKYNAEKNVWIEDEEKKNFIVVWENGKLYSYTKNSNRKLKKCEVMYVHIQKRKMKNGETYNKKKSIIIIPNRYCYLEHYNEKTLNRYFNLINIRKLLKIDEIKSRFFGKSVTRKFKKLLNFKK